MEHCLCVAGEVRLRPRVGQPGLLEPNACPMRDGCHARHRVVSERARQSLGASPGGRAGRLTPHREHDAPGHTSPVRRRFAAVERPEHGGRSVARPGRRTAGTRPQAPRTPQQARRLLVRGRSRSHTLRHLGDPGRMPAHRSTSCDCPLTVHRRRWGTGPPTRTPSFAHPSPVQAPRSAGRMRCSRGTTR